MAEDRSAEDAYNRKAIEHAAGFPALKPRMFTAVDTTGNVWHINLAHVVRWTTSTPGTPGSGAVRAVLLVSTEMTTEDASPIMLADPEGKIDRALVAAFFDCSALDLE